MNAIQRLARHLILKTFDLTVKTIQKLHDEQSAYEQKNEWIRTLPEGTLGADIARCLDQNGVKLVPGFESHDLKHVLLGYQMTPVDEIRLQAFMIGNRNYSLVSFAILVFGASLLPDEWRNLYRDFKRGRKTQPIRTWTIEQYAHRNTLELRTQLMENSTQKAERPALNNLVMYGAVCSVAAGISGMLFCLPFLFSTDIADLIGAGFSFVGGAILTVGGLLALANLSKKSVISES